MVCLAKMIFFPKMNRSGLVEDYLFIITAVTQILELHVLLLRKERKKKEFKLHHAALHGFEEFIL